MRQRKWDTALCELLSRVLLPKSLPCEVGTGSRARSKQIATRKPKLCTMDTSFRRRPYKAKEDVSEEAIGKGQTK
jgi:hypothetical protein